MMKKIVLTLLVIYSLSKVAAATVQGTCRSTTQVTARVGDDVTLQCWFDASLNLNTRTVDWKRDDNQVVHVGDKGKARPDPQHTQFRGRTALSHEDLIRGIMTLQISSVQLRDGGIYSCNVPKVGDSVLSQCVMLTVTNTTEVHPNTTRSPEEDERFKSEVENTDVNAIVWVWSLVGLGLVGLVGAALFVLVKRRKIQSCWKKLRETPAVADANSCQMKTLMKSSAAGDQNQNIRTDPGHSEQQVN